MDPAQMGGMPPELQQLIMALMQKQGGGEQGVSLGGPPMPMGAGQMGMGGLPKPPQPVRPPFPPAGMGY
jgi:hypothetical protein